MPSLLAGVAFARTYSNSNGGTKFGSAEAACKALIGDKPQYKYDGPPERRPNGVYWCYEKNKDGKGERIYAGVVFEEDEPPPDMAKPPDMARPPDMASAQDCTIEAIAALVPQPTGALTGLLDGLSGDDSIGACEADAIRIGKKVFVASRGTVRMERRISGASPKHYFLRHGGLMVDSAFLQFFNAPHHQGPIIVGSESQVRALYEQLYTLCGPNKRKDQPRASSGGQLYNILYGSDEPSCSGDTLKMRPSGKVADWDCGTQKGGNWRP